MAEASPNGTVRGFRQPCWRIPTSIATRHARAAVGGFGRRLVRNRRGLCFRRREHQGPPGGGPHSRNRPANHHIIPTMNWTSLAAGKRPISFFGPAFERKQRSTSLLGATILSLSISQGRHYLAVIV